MVRNALYRAHDSLTAASFALAAVAAFFMLFAFTFEVLSRYAFAAPTTWASDFVSYALCAMVFLAVPELTRTNSHVAITTLLEALRGRPAYVHLARVIAVVAGLTCLVAAAIALDATWHHLRDGVDTMSAYRVPKWTISVFIPYGFFSAGLYFLRDAVDVPARVAAGVTE